MGKILNRYWFIIAFIIFTIGLNSCTNECYDNKNSIGIAGFYSMSSKSAISIDSLTVFGVGAPGDSMILKNAKAVKQVYLPMRMNTDQCQFVFHYEQKNISSPLLNDTLTLNYEAIPHFVSEACGAMYWYKIKDFSYTKHIVDSISIPSMMITNADVETINIFMRTNESSTSN